MLDLLHTRCGIATRRLRFSQSMCDPILGWANKVNLASIRLREGPIHRHIMSTKKKCDLRSTEEFKEKLRRGEATSLHLSVFSDGYEIGFRLNFLEGRVSFTKILSEQELIQILEPLYNIYKGQPGRGYEKRKYADLIKFFE